MRTNTLVNRLVLTLIGFSLTIFFIRAAGQTLTVFDIPDQTINLGQSFSEINLDNYIDVPNNELHKIQWSTTGAGQLSVNIDKSRKASLVPLSDTWTGSETITFLAMDTDQNTGSDAATFTIKELLNADPIVTDIPDQQFDEGTTFLPVSLDDFVSDADNSNDQLTWSTSGNSSLSVDINTGTHIAVIGVPDVDWNGSETIVFKATDPASASGQDAATFTLVPVNDSPVVSDIPDQSIKSGDSFSSIVLDNYVNDVDNSKSELSWAVTGNTNLIPTMDGSHVATINMPANWNGSEKLTFTVTDPSNASASDDAAFSLQASAPTDINLSNSSVVENQPVSTVVGVLSTVDEDAGDTFTYTLVSGDGAGDNSSFDITGSNLVTNEIFDFENRDSYSVRVRSTTDGDGLNTEKPFSLAILNINEAPTNITLSNNTIAEHLGANAVVGNLGTTDPDAGDSFTYTLVSGTGSDDNVSFNISGNELRATASLNYETQSSYTVRVRSTDAGNEYFEKSFSISVTNSNEAPTDITLSNNTIAENQPSNTVVGTLSTTDPDIGDTFTYTLVSGTGSTDNTSFNISGNQLRANASLNFETKSSYSVRIRSTDAASANTEKSFTITVTDANETPTNIILSGNSVADHQPVNTVVATLSSTDPDAGDSFTYTLVSGPGSTDNASFNILGSQLRTNAIFDFTTKSSYSIRIRTTDAGSEFFEKSFTITVTNSNNSPTDITLSNNTIAENQPSNAVVGTLSTTDPDIGDTFTYTLVSGTGSTDNTSFNISGSQLRANASLNFETKSSYSVRIRSTDAASANTEKSFTIAVTDANETPTNIILSGNSVADHQPVNTVVATLSSTDPDAGDSFTYTLDSGPGSGDNASFNILGSQLRTSAIFDFTTKSSYSIRIRTTDAGSAFFEKSFIITVTNSNNSPTDITLSNNTIAENQPSNAVVGTLSTTDPDIGDTFTYTLVSGTGSTDNTSFNISGSQLRANASLNFETKSSYSVRIRSTDAASANTEKSFTITVTDANDAPTDIILSNSTIAEHQLPNTVVGTFSTTDPDAGDSFTYTLVSGTGSGDNASFNILGSQLRANSTLNFETKSSYSVRIRSTDAANANTEKQFTITVTNSNEAPTDITLSNNTIAENQPFNTAVGLLSTTDLDIGDTYTYTLVSGTGSTDNASFNISGSQLRANASLNFETKSSYSVRIRSTDAASANTEKSFTIVVTNENETPTDIALSDNSVADNLPVNTVVGTLSSADPDAGDSFTYTLVSGTGSTDNASFNILGSQLRTNAIFDFATKSSYSIRIRTTDAGSAFFEKSFTITVTNSNSAPTDISLSPNSISENQPANTAVGNLSATDPDVGDTFVFTLVPGTGSTDNGSFSISVAQVRANSPLDYELKSSYTIRVRATDNDGAFFEKAFVITVLNVNEPPSVVSANYTNDGRIGVPHTGNFTGYSDPEGDAPGDHIYQWFIDDNVNGTSPALIPGATEITYRPVSSDGGKYLAFEITPVDIVGTTGLPVRSVFRKVNEAPVASNAHIYAPVTLPGQTIRGRFAYSDAEGNPRGNAIYQWYRKNTSTINYTSPGTPIGTDSVYTLKNADANKYIWFKVRPVATSGSTPGDSVWSNITGPIGSFNASISGTDEFCAGLSMPIMLSVTGGVAPYTAVLTRGTKDTTITGIAESPHIIQVKIAGSYSLKSVSDASLPPDNAIVTTDPVVLTIFPKPSGVLSGGAPICNDLLAKSEVTVNLAGSSPWTFTIRRGNAVNDTTFTGVTTDPFKFNTRITSSPMSVRLISISDAHCTGDTIGSGTLRITYLPSPNAFIQSTDTICPGGTGNLKVTITGTSGPWTITYLRDGANPTDIASITTSPYTLAVQGTGNYTLSKVKQLGVGGCTGRVSGTGKVIPFTVPTATISGSSTFCQYATGNLNINLTGNSPWKFSYKLNSESPVEVVNVSSSPNILPINQEGTYTLVEVFDKNCKGTTSGSAHVTITPAPLVSMSGLAPAYNKDSSEMIHLTGIPPGGSFSGPGVIPYGNDWFFLTSLPQVGTHHIVYSYRESPASCFGYDTAIVRILEANAVIEFPENRVKYCRNEVPFTVTGVNLANSTGSFEISGGTGLVDHGDNTATVDPSLLSVKDYTITYTYFDGLTLSIYSTFEVGKSPEADFKWESECFDPGQSIQFNDASIPNFGNIIAYHWKVYTSTGYDTDSTKDISYTFPDAGNHNIELQVETSYGCSATVTKIFALRPTIPLKGLTYNESFEDTPLSWRSVTLTPAANSWKLDTPAGNSVINRAASGTKCWFTDLPGTNPPTEKSWVSSPCYDFTGMNRPMVKMQIWRDFNGRRDGTNLQATTDSAKSWFNIGQMDDGQNWYNEYLILGMPGNLATGWSNIRDGGWKEARHSLDMLKGKKKVQFRIAYGSDGTVQNTEGFAFDDFWIGERNRMVLIEHFTNVSDEASQVADAKLNALVDADSLNTIDLQYHTSFPGYDPFNAQEPFAPLARQLYYGILNVPTGILNGGYKTGYRFDYLPIHDNDTILVHLESLNDADFDLKFLSSSFNGDQVNFELQIDANSILPSHEYTIHAGVLERKVAGTGSNGGTIYQNVVRALLPLPEGITISGAWPVGGQKNYNYQWDIPGGINRDQLMAFAFMQDEATHEVYQVNKVKIGFSTPTHEILPGSSRDKFIVFPNPASDQAFIRFDQPVQGEVRLEMFNNLGSLIYTETIEHTDTDSEIMTDKLSNGLYIIRVTAGNELLGVTKLNITK